MSRLTHIPFDQGIDQTQDGALGKPTQGLRTVTNLWHQRINGPLVPRPGLDSFDGPGANVSAIGQAAGSNAAIEGGDLYTLASDLTTAAPSSDEWVDRGHASRMLPRDMLKLGPNESTQTRTYDFCTWGKLLLYSIDRTGLAGTSQIYAYDIETKALLSVSTGGQGGQFAYRGETNPPVFIYHDGSTGVSYKTMSDTDLGTYGSGSSLFTETATIAGLRAAGIIDSTAFYVVTTISGSLKARHVTTTGGTVSLVTTETYSNGTQFSVMDDPAGYVWVAWDDGTDFHTSRFTGAAQDFDHTRTPPAGVALVTLAPHATAGRVWLLGYHSTSLYAYAFEDDASALGSGALVGSWGWRPLGQGLVYDGRTYVWAGLFDGVQTRAYLVELAATSTTTSSINYAHLVDPLGQIDMTGSTIVARSRQSAVAGRESRRVSVVVRNPYQADADTSRNEFEPYALIWFADEDHPLPTERQLINVNGSAYIPGGVIGQFSGGSDVACIYPIHPPVVTLSAAGSGGLTASTSYQVKACFVFTDDVGIKHRGPMSVAQTQALGAGDDEIAVDALPVFLCSLDTNSPRVTVEYYRTKANGTVFQLDDSYTGLPSPGQDVSLTISDTFLSNNEFAYDEGILGNGVPPSCRFGTFGKLRLWVAGGFRSFRVYCSRETLQGEVPGFPDDPSHWIDFPDEVTGIACVDDTVIVFTRTKCYSVYGDGPNAAGAGAFVVREIALIGCSAWETVSVTKAGVVWAGSQSIWLLPRGQGQPVQIGQKIRDSLASFRRPVSSFVVTSDDQQIVQFIFAIENIVNGVVVPTTTRFVWSVDSGRWYAWPGNLPRLGGVISRGSFGASTDRALIACRGSATLGLENTNSLEDFSSAFPVVVETHFQQPWGTACDGRLNEWWLRMRNTVADNGTSFYGSAGEAYNFELIIPVDTAYLNRASRPSEPRCSGFYCGFSANSGVTLAGITVEWEPESHAKQASSNRSG